MSTSTHAEGIARRAKLAFEQSSRVLSALPPSSSASGVSTGGPGAAADAARREALLAVSAALGAAKAEIAEANRADVAEAEVSGLGKQMVARLDLFAKKGKWEAMLEGVEQVAKLPSPLDVCTMARQLAAASESHAGTGAVELYKVTCPIGVLLCIFEARPEVVVNIASLAIKSGNAAILKGGKESRRTAAVMSRILSEALGKTALPQDLVQTVETREDIASLLVLDEYIDLVIPRGSNALVRSIQRQARMPVMGHADGLCIGYLHDDAEAALAVGVVVDAKTDYPAACNALETLLVHEAQLTRVWPLIARALTAANVRLHCDPPSRAAVLASAAATGVDAALVVPATDADYDTEFLDLDLAVKTVSGVEQAIDHINAHSSHHTDLILCAPLATTDTDGSGSGSDVASAHVPNPAATRFTAALSSANVYVNASTRFADGFRYGFGTEVGISTGRTHARGPVGLDGLVTYKYIVKGAGSAPQRVADFAAGRPWSHSALDSAYPSL